MERLEVEKLKASDAVPKTRVEQKEKEKEKVKEARDSRRGEVESDSKEKVKEMKKIIAMGQTHDLDLAFLFDTTSSMQVYMDLVKGEMSNIAQGIAKDYPQCKMRVAFAHYRDYDDPEDCHPCDFTTSINVFVKALSRVHAIGGGDAAEDVFSGLERVAALSWRATNRIVFHIADAPCHGTQFHDPQIDDSYPHGDKLGRSVMALLHNLRYRSNVSCYYFLHLNHSTRKMLQEFRQAVAKKPRDEWICQHPFDMKGKTNILRKVVSICSNTISKTLSRPQLIMGYKSIPVVRDWTLIAPRGGKQYKYKWYDNLEELLSKLRSGRSLALESMGHVLVQIAPVPFSNEGSMRWPYYGQMVCPFNQRNNSSMVMKRFKAFYGDNPNTVHAKHRYLEQMEVQSVAAQMAHEFNKYTQAIYGAKQVTYTQVSTVELMDISTFYNMEKELSGKWIRYSNNTGYVNTKYHSNTLQAFSHWTHHHSKGLLMVTDLQGVFSHDNYEYQLCDPAIHCKDRRRFTRTNLGEQGFQLFYKSHKCNYVCTILNLPPPLHVIHPTISIY